VARFCLYRGEYGGVTSPTQIMRWMVMFLNGLQWCNILKSIRIKRYAFWVGTEFSGILSGMLIIHLDKYIFISIGCANNPHPAREPFKFSNLIAKLASIVIPYNKVSYEEYFKPRTPCYIKSDPVSIGALPLCRRCGYRFS
jgi:hypothetical protein